MVEDGAFSHKINYGTLIVEILYLKGHPNRITGSKVTAIADLQISKVAIGPTRNLERHYNRVVGWSVATLGPAGYNRLIPF